MRIVQLECGIDRDAALRMISDSDAESSGLPLLLANFAIIDPFVQAADVDLTVDRPHQLIDEAVDEHFEGGQIDVLLLDESVGYL